MSTLVDLFPPASEEQIPSVIDRTEPSLTAGPQPRQSFAEQQIRNLVQQIFFGDSQKPCRQVVFSPVDPHIEVVSLCRKIGEILACELHRPTCIVDAGFPSRPYENAAQASPGQGRFGIWRDSAEQRSNNLWRLPREVFAEENPNSLSAAWLRGRLAELRLDFDFTVIQGPPCACSEGSLLAASCDGLVLLIEANKTRRATARQLKQYLDATNVRLLGTVLTERTFPIPEAIYKRI